MSVPRSTIYICSGVRLNSKYDHTLYFDDAASQERYFLGKVSKTFSGYTYLRKTWKIQVAATMSEAAAWSYLFFRNSPSEYYYYYFINQIEYINDNTVELSLELDVIQTYITRWKMCKCFVEREHASAIDDNFGVNTVEEDLDVGELVNVGSVNTTLSEMCIMVLSTAYVVPGTGGSADVVLPIETNGIYSGLWLGAIAATSQGMTVLQAYLNELNEAGTIDSIVALWMYPKALVRVTNTVNGETVSVPPYNEFARVNDFTMTQVKYTMKSYLDGNYEPRNKKLLQYPFNMLYVTNNNGGSAVYKWEHFDDDSTFPRVVYFNMFGTPTPEGKAGLYPLNYKNIQHNYDEHLTLDGFPMCAWNSDTYKLWLAQNQNQQNLALANGAAQIAAGVGGLALSMTGIGALAGVAGTGSIISGATSIANLLAQRKDMSVQPPQARGSQSGSLNTVAGFQTFTLYQRCVDEYHARMIDEYFDMYGYAVRRVKMPEIYSRPEWNYIKTVGSHICGDFPVEDQNKINEIFDRGVTFWHDPDHLGNYSYDNTV